jgi:voltage-gated potassium channel
MFSALRAMFRDPEGKYLIVAAISMIALGTVVYMWLEGWSALDALYFSVVTLATVGFGDLHPTTDAAKLFTVFYILSGLGILAAFVSELTKYRTSPVVRLRSRRRGGRLAGEPEAGEPGTDERGVDDEPMPGDPADDDLT